MWNQNETRIVLKWNWDETRIVLMWNQNETGIVPMWNQNETGIVPMWDGFENLVTLHQLRHPLIQLLTVPMWNQNETGPPPQNRNRPGLPGQTVFQTAGPGTDRGRPAERGDCR